MLTSEQIAALAPDAASLAAGRKIAGQPWLDLGRSDRALWGEIKGSGKTPYAVMVDLREFAYRCSCPSRKLPCKHVLGLLFRNADGDSSHSREPERVVEWLDARDARAEKKKNKELEEQRSTEANSTAPSSDASSPKTAAAVKTAAKRDARVSQGVELLQKTLEDVARKGLASLPLDGGAFWRDLSRRLVDAQAPGLARIVAGFAEIPENKEHNEILLADVGKLALLLEAASKMNDASDDLRYEIRQALGVAVSKEETFASGEKLEGAWFALGRATWLNNKVFSARDWFWNYETRRFVYVLQHSYGAPTFDYWFPASSKFSAAFRVRPGVVKLRAIWESEDSMPKRECSEQSAAIGDETIELPDDAAMGIEDFFQFASSLLARAPWMKTIPALLRDVVARPQMTGSAAKREVRWVLLDGEGRSLPIRVGSNPTDSVFPFYAASCDDFCSVFAEWNGRELELLSLWKRGKLECLARAQENF